MKLKLLRDLKDCTGLDADQCDLPKFKDDLKTDILRKAGK